MHGDMKRRLKTTTHKGLIGGALWAWLAGVINWEPSEASGTMKTTSLKLDCCQQAMERILVQGNSYLYFL
jgi:hypothetical protein